MPTTSWYRKAVIPGIAATFLGVGLARFSYTAILPELINAGWFSESQAAYLGASNLIGYSMGALAAAPIATRVGAARLVYLSAFLVVASFLLCAWPIWFEMYLFARFVSGLCGAVLMVIMPSIALTALPPNERGKGAAMIFTGIGIGILLSATLVPLMSGIALSLAWLGLAVSGAVSLLLIRGIGAITNAPAPEASNSAHSTDNGVSLTAASVMFAYAMDAVGFVPHTLFWVDYLQRHAHLAVASSSIQWSLFGLGAVSGPFLVAWARRKVSWHGLLVGGLALKALAVFAPLVSQHIALLTLSSLLVGALVPGMVAIVSGRMSELAGPKRHAHFWGLATTAFACFQGISAVSFAWLYNNAVNGHAWMYLIAGSALLLGAIVAVGGQRRKRYP